MAFVVKNNIHPFGIFKPSLGLISTCSSDLLKVF